METASHETPKYAVLKWNDWEAIKTALTGGGLRNAFFETLPLDDAEVIRHQDVTAAAIFYHYSQTIQNFLDMAESLLGEELDPERRMSLLSIAMHFGAAAEAAESHPRRKLPD